MIPYQYGDIDLGQCWLGWWLVTCWHQAIIWTHDDSWSVSDFVLHLPVSDFTMSAKAIIPYNVFGNDRTFKISATFPGENELSIDLLSELKYSLSEPKLTWKRQLFSCIVMLQINGLVQERRNSIANALELYLSWANLSKWPRYNETRQNR